MTDPETHCGKPFELPHQWPVGQDARLVGGPHSLHELVERWDARPEEGNSRIEERRTALYPQRPHPPASPESGILAPCSRS